MVAADFLMSPVFLWVTANAIVIWLVSSSRRGPRTEGAVPSTPAGHDDGEAVHDAVDSSIYTSSSEYEAFPDADSARRARAEAAAAKRLAREAARAARKKADRPRVRKKLPAGHDASTTSPRAVAAAAAPARELHDETRRRAETPPVACAAEPRLVAGAGAGDEDEDEDVSMDSLWQSIVERRAARPVVVQKSESWGNDELPRLQRVAETAATRRAEVRKSVSAISRAAAPQQPAPQQPPAVPSAIRQLGWRTRDVLVTITPDELLRRAESFIRRQHEHLRLQRQESEQRQLRRGLHAPPLIRV